MPSKKSLAFRSITNPHSSPKHDPMKQLERLKSWRYTRQVFFAAALFLASACAYGQNVVYVRSTLGEPWGRTDNDGILTKVFTNWQNLRYETVSPAALFAPTNTFIFMEGSDNNATAMSAFLGKNLSAMSNWANGGGSLFLNAAPNVGGNINFGFG